MMSILSPFDFSIKGGWLHTSFIDYLRLAFSWGGFPGMGRLAKRPYQDIVYLITDLEPF